MAQLITAAFVRKAVDILPDEAGDSVLNEYVDWAQEMVLVDISARRVHEEMVDIYGLAPDIDGSNKQFYVQNKLIADTNFDMTIDSNDVTVHLWPDEDDESTITTAPVTSVNEDTGLIILTTAPASTIQRVTCSYRFYKSPINWVIMQIATALLTGVQWLRKDKLLLPDRVNIGAYKWQVTEPVYVRLKKEYRDTVNYLKTNKGTRVTAKANLPWNNQKLINLYYAEIGGRY